MELRIYQILRLAAVPMELSGGKYLFQAVKLCVSDEFYLDFLTKGLYPVLADLFDTTPYCIEKNIRRAISKAWDCGMNEFFECNMSGLKRKPSNGELLKKLVFILKLRF